MVKNKIIFRKDILSNLKESYSVIINVLLYVQLSVQPSDIQGSNRFQQSKFTLVALIEWITVQTDLKTKPDEGLNKSQSIKEIKAKSVCVFIKHS